MFCWAKPWSFSVGHKRMQSNNGRFIWTVLSSVKLTVIWLCRFKLAAMADWKKPNNSISECVFKSSQPWSMAVSTKVWTYKQSMKYITIIYLVLVNFKKLLNLTQVCWTKKCKCTFNGIMLVLKLELCELDVLLDKRLDFQTEFDMKGTNSFN